jgi:hypothetical protein
MKLGEGSVAETMVSARHLTMYNFQLDIFAQDQIWHPIKERTSPKLVPLTPVKKNILGWMSSSDFTPFVLSGGIIWGGLHVNININ